MSNNLNECDDTFWNGSILGYWLKYTHTRKEHSLICRVVESLYIGKGGDFTVP